MNAPDVVDPWSVRPFIINFGNIVIKGPFDSEKNRINLDFSYRQDTYNKCNILQTVRRTNNYNNIALKLYEDIAIIENISRSNIYRGSEYMLLALQIIYKLGYKVSILQDVAYFTCDRKMNFFSNIQTKNSHMTDIKNKIIYVLRFRGTFYMPFGFIPVIQSSELSNINLNNIEYIKHIKFRIFVDISEIIDSLLQNLYKISWDDINNYINSIEKLLNTNTYKNSNRLLYNYRIMNYVKWKNYWKNICKSWKKFYEKFRDVVDSPFSAFIIYDKDECDLFINWLELYSFSINQTFIYSSSIFNNKLTEEKILAGVDSFKKLKILLEKCEWINIKIKEQPISSIYIKTI